MQFYYNQMALTDIELVKVCGKTVSSPDTMIEDIDKYKDGKIVIRTWGIVYPGKMIKGK